MPVVPVRIEDIAPTKAMAYFMGPVHWLDALTPPIEKHLDRLVESIKALLAVSSPHSDVNEPSEPSTPIFEATKMPSPHVRTPEKDVQWPSVVTATHALKPTDFANKSHAPTGSVGPNARPRHKLQFSVLGALFIGVMLVIESLVDGRPADCIVAVAVAEDVTTAKIATLVSAGITGYFVLLNLLAQNLLFAVVEMIGLCCLLYALAQMLELQNPPAAE